MAETDIKAKIENLKTNPIFSFSLGSKELFHSNFLAWLLERNDNRSLLENLINFVKPEPKFEYEANNTLTVKVYRELLHYDLVVWIQKNESEEDLKLSDFYSDKSLILVIENKFKSYPDIDQLERYSQQLKIKSTLTDEEKKADNGLKKLLLALKSNSTDKESTNFTWSNNNYEYVEKIKPFKILLSPVDVPRNNSDNLDWKWLDYEDYLEWILDLFINNKSCSAVENYKYIKDYYDSTKTILDALNHYVNSETVENYLLDDNIVKELKELRINDVFEKNKGGRLTELVKNKNKENKEYIEEKGWEAYYRNELLSSLNAQVNIGFLEKGKPEVEFGLGFETDHFILALHVKAARDFDENKKLFEEFLEGKVLTPNEPFEDLKVEWNKRKSKYSFGENFYKKYEKANHYTVIYITLNDTTKYKTYGAIATKMVAIFKSFAEYIIGI